MKVVLERLKFINNGNTIAFVDVGFEDSKGRFSLTVKGFKVMNGKNGRFLAAPSTKDKNEKWWPSVWFKTEEQSKSFGEYILRLVAEKEASSPGEEEAPSSPDQINWEE